MVKVEEPCKRVSAEDVIELLKLMNNEKAAGPSGITVELLKVCKKECVKRLTQVASDMLNGKKMPASWKKVI